jgi:hypothetical protein
MPTGPHSATSSFTNARMSESVGRFIGQTAIF